MRNNIIYIKTPKTYSESIVAALKSYCEYNNLIYLRKPYPEIKHHTKMFNVSTDHICRNKIKILDKLIDIRLDTLYISSIRNPIKRAMSHYYNGDHYTPPTEFDEYYSNNRSNNNFSSINYEDTHSDNFMSWYMGFTSIDQITKKSVLDRYNYIIVCEEFSKSLKILGDILEYDLPIPHLNATTPNKKYNSYISTETTKKFLYNNKMDYKLYNICIDLFI